MLTLLGQGLLVLGGVLETQLGPDREGVHGGGWGECSAVAIKERLGREILAGELKNESCNTLKGLRWERGLYQHPRCLGQSMGTAVPSQTTTTCH